MSGKRITREDILPMSDYRAMRVDKRRAMRAVKDRRRMPVGPDATFHFECYDTMWHQVHEMLCIGQGGEEQIADELAAYNPLIPQGRDLVSTMMFEIVDEARRKRVLGGLGGVEATMFLEIDGEKVMSVADVDRSSAAGRASSVQFVHFPLTDAQAEAFKQPGARIVLGIDHPNYRHMAVLPEEIRAELAGDLD